MAFTIDLIENRSDLANFLNVPLKKLTYILYVKKPESYYKSFDIPKKSGGTRKINAPTGDLKSLQRNLAQYLWKQQKYIWEQNGGRIPNVSHAFEENKSIITNAKIHRNKKYVLNFDLDNFFDSFHFGRIRGFFMENNGFKVSKEIATVIAQITCYNQRLPQGAPTSPIVTNLICQIFDYHILKLAKKYRLDYTRYADDLTFSTNDTNFSEVKNEFISKLNQKVEKAGFLINESKTRLSYKSSQQKVTGLVVNNKINVDRIYCRETNAMAHNLYKHGSFHINGEPGALAQLEGRYSFINQLDRYNNSVDKQLFWTNQRIDNQLDRFSSRVNVGKHNFRVLNGRERQYQKFLFYKYFYGNDKPLLVTEGKTDIVYLKSALKNLYLDYPDLITKKNDGKFEFHITFFRKSKRLRYFFDYPLDGADAMQKIYNLYCGKNNMPNYFEYFKNINEAKNPVFLVFDNEVSTKNKPLCTFSSHCNFTDSHKSDLSSNLVFKIIDQSNLYVLTNPMPNNKNESEIEDLFDSNTLSHKISGKSFSLDDKADKNKYYGKEIFSKYIASDYQSIDFINFKPMLNKIVEVINTFQT